MSEFLERRREPSNVEKALRRMADPMSILEWEGENGLTVASVNRYILSHLGE